jgi:hypothetical protein
VADDTIRVSKERKTEMIEIIIIAATIVAVGAGHLALIKWVCTSSKGEYKWVTK